MADSNTQAVIDALQAVAGAIQNAITNAGANAAAAAAAGLPQLPAAPAAVAGAFAHTPLGNQINQVLDYSTKEDQKYFEQATKSLDGSGKGFDVEPSSFQLFINLAHTQSCNSGILEANANMMITKTRPKLGPRLIPLQTTAYNLGASHGLGSHIPWQPGSKQSELQDLVQPRDELFVHIRNPAHPDMAYPVPPGQPGGIGWQSLQGDHPRE